MNTIDFKFKYIIEFKYSLVYEIGLYYVSVYIQLYNTRIYNVNGYKWCFNIEMILVSLSDALMLKQEHILFLPDGQMVVK